MLDKHLKELVNFRRLSQGIPTIHTVNLLRVKDSDAWLAILLSATFSALSHPKARLPS